MARRWELAPHEFLRHYVGGKKVRAVFAADDPRPALASLGYLRSRRLMRIALVDPLAYTPPYDHALASALAAQGHSVTLLTSRFAHGEAPAPDGYDREELFAPVSTRIFRRAPARLALKALEYPPSVGRLVRRIERLDPDVVHVQWLPRPEYDLRWLRRVADERPLVLTAHDVLPRRSKALRAWPDVLETAERVIVHSHRAVEQLVELGLGRERIARIPHPVFEGEELPAPSGRTLLFFGLIRDYKGLDVLLEALPLIPEARLVVAGDPLDPVEQVDLDGRVDWRLGFRPDAEVHELMSAAAAVVLPYRRLDSSGVLATAIGYRRPVVVVGCWLARRDRARVRCRRGRPARGPAGAGAGDRAPARAEGAEGRSRGRGQGCGRSHLGRERRRARPALPRGTQVSRFLKRLIDRVAAAVLLVLLSPVLVVIAAWILVDGGRPVLLAQERVGKGGRRFRMLKFRTMVPNALELAHELTDDPYGVVPDDPRITKPGRFLRRTSLDELPQLLNVLAGQMSLVGPRPDLVEQAANYSERDRGRLAVEPGITGWSQVNGREAITWPERIDQDLWYIENWSLPLDLRIIVLTFTQLRRDDEQPVEDEMNIERARARTRAETNKR